MLSYLVKDAFHDPKKASARQHEGDFKSHNRDYPSCVRVHKYNKSRGDEPRLLFELKNCLKCLFHLGHLERGGVGGAGDGGCLSAPDAAGGVADVDGILLAEVGAGALDAAGEDLVSVL